MRVVVSGTHASGKTTLISDLAARHPAYEVLGDAYEDIDGEYFEVGAGLFVAQFEVVEERLCGWAPGTQVIAERGPLDMLAYLLALSDLGRSAGAAATVRRLAARASAAMRHVDVVVWVPLGEREAIRVGEDEDPELREAVDAILADLIDDPALMGAVRVIEVAGSRAARVAQVEESWSALAE